LILPLQQLMKKLIAVISLVLYFTATCGIVVNSHYCMKRLVSVHLFEAKADVCGLCGMDVHDSGGCCRDEARLLKMEQDQIKTPVSLIEIPSYKTIISPVSDFIVASTIESDKEQFSQSHSPPLLSKQDTYLQIGVFRI
jgi:hypothetical protein